MDVADIARLLGMSRQAAHKLVERTEDFPRAESTVMVGRRRWRRWAPIDVEEWAHRHGRQVVCADHGWRGPVASFWTHRRALHPEPG